VSTVHAASRLIEHPRELEALLEELGASHVAWISWQGIEWTAPGTEKAAVLAKLREPAPSSPREAWEAVARPVSEAQGPAADFVSHWISLGDLYEDLLGAPEPPSFLVCRDEMSAHLLNRRGSPLPGARWIRIDRRTAGPKGAPMRYQEETRGWLESLPFDVVIREGAIGSSQPVAASPDRGDSLAPAPGMPHARQLGSWTWTRPGGPTPVPGRLEVFPMVGILHTQGLHPLRLQLEALTRWQAPTLERHVLVMGGEEDPSIREYLRWFRAAHPSFAIEFSPRLEAGAARQRVLEAADSRGLKQVLLLEDRAILPPEPARSLGEHPAVLLGLPLDLEVSAHAVTGNLDVHAHFTTLLDACRSRAGARPFVVGEWADRETLARAVGQATPSARFQSVDVLVLGGLP
jgi:hypothetical protein